MTAFDNIKTNNWPAASNDLEDFLVLELPLNDQAALTSSRRDIVAGRTVLHPKRTLTNTGVSLGATGTIYSTSGTLTGSSWGAGHEISSAFRQGYLLYGGSGSGAFAAGNTAWRYTFPSPITVTTNIKIYFWRNGGNIKVNAGESDVQEDNSSSGYTTWTIPASSVGVLKNVELYTAGNTGPYWSGIEVDGVQLYDAPGGTKKHYDNNAVFTAGGSGNVITYDVDTREALKFGTGDFTVEAWVKQEFTDATSGSSACILEIGDHFTNTGVIFWASDSSTKAYSSSGYGSGGALTLGQWHHVAWSRSNGTLKTFLDGQQTSSVAFTNNLTDSQYATTGKSTSSTSVGYHFNGDIQDLRVYKGVAKYTANFTPPSAILG